MLITAPEFTVTAKKRNRGSPTFTAALEAVQTALESTPGLYREQLEAAVLDLAGCSRTTAQRAIKAHRGDGVITATREGNKIRNYWDDTPKPGQSDRLLTPRQRVISAANALRVTGSKLSPMEWSLRVLEETRI